MQPTSLVLLGLYQRNLGDETGKSPPVRLP